MLVNNLKFIMNNFFPIYKDNGELNLSPPSLDKLKKLIQNQITDEISLLVSDDSFNITGRTGVGKIADVPWVGIHHNSINSLAKTGVYISLLFHVDGRGVSLSIQHGTDTIKNLVLIRQKVKEVRETLQSPLPGFHSNDLFLRPTPVPNRLKGKSKRPAKYEIANIIGKTYSISELEEESFRSELITLVKYYKRWAESIKYSDALDEINYQHPISDIYVDTSLLSDDTPPQKRKAPSDTSIRVGSTHPLRDAKQGLIALKSANWMCEADNTHLTFSREDNTMYMEKHHLIPMEQYFNFDISIDHHYNIFSLCPTCHRKIHHSNKEDKKKILRDLYKQREEIYKKTYKTSFDQLLLIYGVTK